MEKWEALRPEVLETAYMAMASRVQAAVKSLMDEALSSEVDQRVEKWARRWEWLKETAVRDFVGNPQGLHLQISTARSRAKVDRGVALTRQFLAAEPDGEEDLHMLRAMRDSNLPKFLRDDILLFRAIIKDLFPGVQVKS